MSPEVVGALRSARNAIIARGWRPGDGWVPAVCDYRPNAPSTWLGAQEARGPLDMIHALAYAQASTWRLAYEALLRVTGADSLSVWQDVPGRTEADVLAAFEAAAIDARE